MIGRIHGVLLQKQAPDLLVDVNGVGYEILAPMTSIYELPAVGEIVTLHTHLNISENAHQLFGFASLDERRLFRALIKVNGVGPKMALAILSGMEAKVFVQCVMDDNITALVKVPGVGKKTAERLVIEMRDRLKEWHIDLPLLAAAGEAPKEVAAMTANDKLAEAESALVALGYKPTEAAKMIASASKGKTVESSEELIRLALRSMVQS